MKSKKFELAANKVIAAYIPLLMLQKHTIRLEYGTENQKAIMECSVRYPYLDAKITYSDLAVAQFDRGEDITLLVVHELCHIITDPLYCKARDRWASSTEIEDEREGLTDYIARIATHQNL